LWRTSCRKLDESWTSCRKLDESLLLLLLSSPREKKLRSRRWPVGRAAATHRVQRRPDRPPPIRNDRRHPGTQMCQPRAGARRCTRASPVRRDRMWSLPISPPTAYILLINSLRRVNESVGTPAGVHQLYLDQDTEIRHLAVTGARARGACPRAYDENRRQRSRCAVFC
jgi:hypothetical protein